VAEAFKSAPNPARIPSWEQVEGPSGMQPPGFAFSPGDAELLATIN
jgi:hypothetical protein